MNRGRFACAVALAAALGVAGSHTSHAQENTAVDHAKRVLDLLGHDKFDEVAGEFNAPVAAAIVLVHGSGPNDRDETLGPNKPFRDLQGWRDAHDGHAGVTIKSYPTPNHLFLPGEGKSTPSEYERAGHIPDFVLDDIAIWIKKISS